VVKGHYGSGGSGEVVVIWLVVFRLATKGTDVVVSLNFPVREGEGIEILRGGDTGAVMRWMESVEGLREVEGVLRDIISSFEILDWSLFDEDEE
jgi:hypothetical protein